jgi:glycosyltransferase involved in cell wall biosynthesis
MPKISVCIPTYNAARYLREAIESVLQQEFSDYELVICDDASTDDTSTLVSSYTDPRIRYFRSQKNQGQAATWNRCIALAQGQYVALLHADDRYLRGFLTERVSTLDTHPEVGLAFGPVVLIDEDGVILGERSFSELDLIWPAPTFLKYLLLDCIIFPPSFVVRRSCFDVAGPFNEAHFWGIDWEFCLRLSAHFGVAYSTAVCSAYRIHGASATPVALSTARSSRDGFEVLGTIFRELSASPQLLEYASLRRPAFRAFAMRALSAAGYMCERNDLLAVRTHLQFALCANPKLLSRPTVWALSLSCCLGSWVYRTFRKVRPL